MGVPWQNNCYDFIHGNLYAPRTTKYLNTYLFKSHVGMPIINYEYEFKNGWLMTCQPYCDDFKTYISAPVDSMIKIASSMDTDFTYKDQKQVAVKLHHSLTNGEHHNPIECEWCRQGLGHAPSEGGAQPSVGFGIMAVPKPTEDVRCSSSKFQEVAAFFQVDTEIVLNTDLDTINPLQICLPALQQHFDKKTFNMYIPCNRQTHSGLYPYFPTTNG